jgi:hypothetical protein
MPALLIGMHYQNTTVVVLPYKGPLLRQLYRASNKTSNPTFSQKKAFGRG